jgi:hypothetical protein
MSKGRQNGTQGHFIGSLHFLRPSPSWQRSGSAGSQSRPMNSASPLSGTVEFTGFWTCPIILVAMVLSWRRDRGKNTIESCRTWAPFAVMLAVIRKRDSDFPGLTPCCRSFDVIFSSLGAERADGRGTRTSRCHCGQSFVDGDMSHGRCAPNGCICKHLRHYALSK